MDSLLRSRFYTHLHAYGSDRQTAKLGFAGVQLHGSMPMVENPVVRVPHGYASPSSRMLK